MITPVRKLMDQLKTRPHPGDGPLINSIRRGGSEASQAMMELYAMHRTAVKSFIHTFFSKTNAPKCDPQDLMHDAFVILIRKLKATTDEGINAKSFWIGIARHLWLNQLKKDGRIQLVNDEEVLYGMQEESPESLYARHDEFQYVSECFARSGQRCKELLLLWIEDYTMEEIASRLNLSSAAMARKIKHECFKKVKEMLFKGNKRPV